MSEGSTELISGVGSTEPPKSEGRGFAAAWSGPSARRGRLCRRRERT
jgi:hypothetical protein